MLVACADESMVPMVRNEVGIPGCWQSDEVRRLTGGVTATYPCAD